MLNDKDLVEDAPEQHFKLSPTRGDREAFKHAMDNGLAVSEFEDSLLVQAHEFFKDQVNQWLESGLSSEESMTEALETAVTSMFEMVVIDLGLEDDANIIFETLNARGTPLEQSDLIKNYVLSQLPQDAPGRENIWEGLDNPWWRETVRQGRLLRPRLDMLFNYWLAMRTGSEVRPPDVFREFRKHAEDSNIATIMPDVQRDLQNYRRYDQGPRPEEIESFYYRMDVMQVGVFTPALLLLLSADNDSQVRAFNALESFLVRRMVSRRTTKDYNGLALQLANRLRNGGLADPARTVIDYFREQTADSREWPEDDSLQTAMVSLPIYRLLTRGRLRLVLEGIETSLRSNKAEQPDVPRNLTIEHLMPLGWEENWPLYEPYDRERRNSLVHTIGNLTLVNRRLNSSMSNGPWEDKRKELQEHSVMTLNAELSHQDSWNEEEIIARSRRMANLIAKCWPGPDSSRWD